jgi:D-tyrosyl-tRNA(Tyr) deacylase
MIALLQRVTEASVRVGGAIIGAIDRGLLVFIGVEQGDTADTADRLVERVLSYRVFPDTEQRMNLCVRDVDGGVLLVPQFTLAADTRKGNRPSFTPAAAPADGERMFGHVVERTRQDHANVATGKFGADMKVTLTNDGPVTFWLRVAPPE